LINGEKHADGGSAVARAKRRTSLTDAFVRTRQPKAKPYRVSDARVPGLVLRVWPSGKKSFYVDYRCRGQRGFYSIGQYPIFGVAQAREEALGVLHRAAKGQDPAADKQAQRGATLKEVHGRYLDEYAVRHNKSWQQGKFLIEKYVLPRLGKLPVKTVGRAEVRAAIGGVKPILANAILAALSATLSWAVEQDLIITNVCKGIKRNPTRSRERILSDSEIPRVWAALDHMGTPQACALQMIWLTAQRPGEVSCMRYEHLSRDGWWLMPGAPDPKIGWPGLKNARDHRTWLATAARAIIDGQRQGNVTPIKGHVFVDVGDRPVDHLDAVMRAICKELNIRDKITPHDLRRSALSTITRLGFSRHVMDLVANHRTDTVTDVYDRHSYTDEIKQVMEAVADHIMDLAQGSGAGAIASR
jgi:integrase